MNPIQKMFDNYHKKVTVAPNLYVQKDYIQVYLPKELHEFANASAGRNNRGPIGIRVYCDNPHREISRVFSSLESLERFIYSSERNAIQDVVVGGVKVRARISKPRRPHAASFRKWFWENHDKQDLEALKRRVDVTELRQTFDKKLSTNDLEELKLKFNL